jgi:hypothetical protein
MNARNRPNSQPRHKELLIGGALFLGVLGFYSLSWFYGLTNGSHHFWGGVSTVGAQRVLAGDLPYRDFWTIYAPGQFYLLALLFRIFGTHLFVEVVAGSVVCSAAAYFCYRLVMNLVEQRFLAIACAGVFVAATFNTGYYKRLGSYPSAILLIFIALGLTVLYYNNGRIRYLVFAGLATGAAGVFKHDIGGYTAIAIAVGLGAYQLSARAKKHNQARAWLAEVAAYLTGIALVVLPPLIYFTISVGQDMLRDLVIFPLTDFRFARREAYPSLLPTGVLGGSGDIMIKHLLRYVNFTIPFFLFLVGLVVVGLAVRRRNSKYAGLGVTFTAAFFLHYLAAHVQINTHIITLSVYASCLGAIFDQLTGHRWPLGQPTLARFLILSLVTCWLLSLLLLPGYALWNDRKQATAKLEMARVSGFRVTPEEARTFTDLLIYLDTRIPPDQKLFVGLHRHDVLIIGDVMIYFLLGRPNATRYQELHPAITDTADVQQEIIHDLQSNHVPLIILKHIFSDKTLEQMKSIFLRDLPRIGATDLDEFIHQNYARVREFGPYEVWERKYKGSAPGRTRTSDTGIRKPF